MRTFLAYTHAALYLLRILPSMVILRRKQNEHAYNKTNQFAKILSDRTLRIVKTEVVVNGKENIPDDNRYVLVSNHQGNFDIPILLSHINPNLAFIAKTSLQKVPLFGTWMTLKRCIFIDQSDPRQSVRQLSKGGEQVKHGTPLCIFPEGHRSKDHSVQSFSNAGARMAKKAGVQILPVSISGSYRVMEANEGKIKPAHVVVTVHPLVNPEEHASASTLNTHIHTMITSSVNTP